MSAWVVVPSLLKLRDEFNLISPKRDKGADGTIGDSSHTSSSDHTPDEDSRVLRDHDGDSKNEVHALDIDSTGPWPGTGTQKERFHKIIMGIIAREKKRWLDPNDKCRLNYVIWDRKIYDKDNDFEGKTYGGSDPHTNHAHFSGRYETVCENDVSSWGVYVAPSSTPTPAKVTMVKLSGDVPQLKKGMSDPVSGKNYVKRVQAILNWMLPGESPLTVDGDYGDATAAGIKEIMKNAKTKSSTNGSVVGEPEWNTLYGL